MLTPKPEALLIDLDGTLLDLRDKWSEYAHEAISSVVERMPVGISTGRFGQDVISFGHKLGLESPLVVENGARVIEPNFGETIWHNPLEKTATLSILDQLELHDYRFYACQKGRTIRARDDFNNFEDVSAVSVDAVERDNALRVATLGENIQNLRAELSTSSLGSWYVTFSHKDSDKGRGARIFADWVGVNIDRVMAIGDGLNDVPMFKSVGISVAMGNADPKVKSEAMFLTADAAEEGLAQALNKFILSR